MMLIESFCEGGRSGVLLAELRQLRLEADVRGTAGTIHRLRNCVMTAEGALKLAMAPEQAHSAEEIASLLDLAASRLREARRIMAASHRTAFPGSAHLYSRAA